MFITLHLASTFFRGCSILLVTIVAHAGCNHTVNTANNAAQSPQMNLSRETKSSRGSFHVIYKPSPDPVLINQDFGLEVTVRDGADPSKVIDNVVLTVDTKMPAHNHGMNVRPEVSVNPAASFSVNGMRFHMPGHWEIYLHITRDGITERATFNVVL